MKYLVSNCMFVDCVIESNSKGKVLFGENVYFRNCEFRGEFFSGSYNHSRPTVRFYDCNFSQYTVLTDTVFYFFNCVMEKHISVYYSFGALFDTDISRMVGCKISHIDISCDNFSFLDCTNNTIRYIFLRNIRLTDEGVYRILKFVDQCINRVDIDNLKFPSVELKRYFYNYISGKRLNIVTTDRNMKRI